MPQPFGAMGEAARRQVPQQRCTAELSSARRGRRLRGILTEHLRARGSERAGLTAATGKHCSQVLSSFSALKALLSGCIEGEDLQRLS